MNNYKNELISKYKVKICHNLGRKSRSVLAKFALDWSYHPGISVHTVQLVTKAQTEILEDNKERES